VKLKHGWEGYRKQLRLGEQGGDFFERRQGEGFGTHYTVARIDRIAIDVNHCGEMVSPA
jgi:hypothetical protein